MSLAIGTALGSYEIIAPLGAGGMGEVYRARDTKLGREVAIKILPEAFTHDSERVARFQREAQMLAAVAISRSIVPIVCPRRCIFETSAA